MKCAICGTENPTWSWTDTHGVAQCCTCGTPYLIYHYRGEGEDKHRVDREPEIMIQDHYIPLIREYWETRRRLMPSGYSVSASYELATESDAKAFYRWIRSNRHRITTVTAPGESTP